MFHCKAALCHRGGSLLRDHSGSFLGCHCHPIPASIITVSGCGQHDIKKDLSRPFVALRLSRAHGGRREKTTEGRQGAEPPPPWRHFRRLRRKNLFLQKGEVLSVGIIPVASPGIVFDGPQRTTKNMVSPDYGRILCGTSSLELVLRGPL